MKNKVTHYYIVNEHGKQISITLDEASKVLANACSKFSLDASDIDMAIEALRKKSMWEKIQNWFK